MPSRRRNEKSSTPRDADGAAACMVSLQRSTIAEIRHLILFFIPTAKGFDTYCPTWPMMKRRESAARQWQRRLIWIIPSHFASAIKVPAIFDGRFSYFSSHVIPSLISLCYQPSCFICLSFSINVVDAASIDDSAPLGRRAIVEPSRYARVSVETETHAARGRLPVIKACRRQNIWASTPPEAIMVQAAKWPTSSCQLM